MPTASVASRCSAGVAAQLAEGLDADWQPAVIHGHDWHAGLAPVYLHAASLRHGRRLAGSVFTIHNLAFQGVFPMSAFEPSSGLPAEFFGLQGLEFYGQISFMKGGLRPRRQADDREPDLRARDPGRGTGLRPRRRAARARCRPQRHPERRRSEGLEPGHRCRHRRALQRAGAWPARPPAGRACSAEFALDPQFDAPLFGIVSRLTDQKGFNLVLAGLDELLGRGAQLVVLGSGDAALEAAAPHRRGRPSDAGRAAPRLRRGARTPHRRRRDVILVPSRFEPCGLTQLYGLRYGTLPLVRRVGGLADSVVDCALENLADGSATGFVFERFDVGDYRAAVRRACVLHARPDEWRRVQATAMAQNFDWDAAAARYAALYRAAVA